MKFALIVLLLAVQTQAADHEISQKNKEFSVKEIKIKVGDSINFKNEEKDVTHNVFSLGPTNGFELKSQPPGKSSKVKFSKPGQADVECAIHQNMKLKVTVEK